MITYNEDKTISSVVEGQMVEGTVEGYARKFIIQDS